MVTGYCVFGTVTKIRIYNLATNHTVLKTSPGAAIFGQDMLFDVPFIADWSKIGEYRQKQTDKNTRGEMTPT